MKATKFALKTDPIKRFDVRGMLDFIPTTNPHLPVEPTEDDELEDELNFERYQDLVEHGRLQSMLERRVESSCCQSEAQSPFLRIREWRFAASR